VQALVFVKGWMPDEGESIQQLVESGGPFAGSSVPAATRPVPFRNPRRERGVDLSLDRELFPEAFCADVDPETAKVIPATGPSIGSRPRSAPLGPGSAAMLRRL
jgi:hypothetical protein